VQHSRSVFSVRPWAAVLWACTFNGTPMSSSTVWTFGSWSWCGSEAPAMPCGHIRQHKRHWPLDDAPLDPCRVREPERPRTPRERARTLHSTEAGLCTRPVAGGETLSDDWLRRPPPDRPDLSHHDRSRRALGSRDRGGGLLVRHSRPGPPLSDGFTAWCGARPVTNSR